MPAKLKVFQARLGFYDTVVAAPSQAAALRAWGTHQNLFADGEARSTVDPADVEAALAHPNVPLRRPVGTNEPFGLDPGLPRLPNLPDGKKPGITRSKPIAKPAPDRSALDAARASLAKLGEDQQREEDGFRARRAQLEDEERQAERRWRDARTKAETTVARERQAYVKGGGKPDQ